MPSKQDLIKLNADLKKAIELAKKRKEEQLLASASKVFQGVAQIKGAPGEPGKQGPVGPKGPVGDRGPRGEQGERGLPGRDGRDGMDGADGRPGKDGRDGRPGDTGPMGPRGPEGPAGKDGAPGTQIEASQIRDKLQALIGNERLDASAIKNLPSNVIVGGGGRTIVQSGSSGTATIDGHRVLNAGVYVQQSADLNFTGAGVSVADVGGTTTVTISGAAGVAGHVIYDEATKLDAQPDLVFEGAGVSVANVGTSTVVTIAGGAGAPAGSDAEVQFNSGGSFGASEKFQFRGGEDTIVLGVVDSTFIIRGADGSAGVGGGDIHLIAGLANTQTDTQSQITINAGNGAGTNSGSIGIAAGRAYTIDGNGGGLNINAGSAYQDGGGTGTGGDISFISGDGGDTSGDAGSIYFSAGYSESDDAGNIVFTPGTTNTGVAGTNQFAGQIVVYDFAGGGDQMVVTDDNGVLGVQAIPGGTTASGITTTTVAGAYTAYSTWPVILCNGAGGGFTVTLPPAASSTDFYFYVKKTDSSANTIVVDGDGGDLIDGETTQSCDIQYDCMQIVCDGSSWHII